MIVCHEQKFIFLKTQKTACTSVEMALSSLCGDKCVITPSSRAEYEAFRQDRKPQNWRRKNARVWLERARDAVTLGKMRPAVSRKHGRNFHPHIEAGRLREYVGDRVWNNYFKFTVERNPWDRQVSYYFFKKSKESIADSLSFEDFIETRAGRIKNFQIYSVDGQIVVDHVMRYEYLGDDLRAVLDHLSVDRDITLPRVKGNVRPESQRDYRDMYGDKAREAVGRLYRNEIDSFGYRFEVVEPMNLDGRIQAKSGVV